MVLVGRLRDWQFQIQLRRRRPCPWCWIRVGLQKPLGPELRCSSADAQQPALRLQGRPARLPRDGEGVRGGEELRARAREGEEGSGEEVSGSWLHQTAACDSRCAIVDASRGCAPDHPQNARAFFFVLPRDTRGSALNLVL